MNLYHFTSQHHLPRIIADGLIRTTESNVGSVVPVDRFPAGAHAGPDVVWLMDSPDPFDHPHGLNGSAVDKTEVRFTVDPGRFAIRWEEWAWTAAMDPQWRDIFVRQGGGPEAAARWWVLPAPLRRSRWIEVAVLNPTTRRYEKVDY